MGNIKSSPTPVTRPREVLWVDGVSREHLGKSNQVCTALYTRWTFIPRNLIDQLSQFSNLYFFLVGILQMVPKFSVTGGLPAMWLPLSQVMLVVGILEGYADWKRHQSDKTENSREVFKFSSETKATEVSTVMSSLTTTTWSELCVGDLVFLSNRETIPADLLILASSRRDGRVMIESASLDGETNLKFRSVPLALYDRGYATFENAQRFNGTITYDPPSPVVDAFRGSCSLRLIGDENGNPVEFPITPDNVILRGCKIRNTEWAIGLILYAGHDTKIYQNTARPSNKISRMESETNMLLLVIVCLSYSVGSVVLDVLGYYAGRPFTVPVFMVKRALTRFVSWNLLIVNLIPISLFFFLNISRALQAMLMQRDTSMEHPETLERLVVRNDRLNSDLGQVHYMFTDKTGTLTRNYMELRKLAIGGIPYEGTGISPVETPHVSLDSARLKEVIVAEDAEVWDFFIHLAVNHSVFIETTESSGDEETQGMPEAAVLRPDHIVYSASSADEGVLVYGAQHYGFALVGQAGSSIDVVLPSRDITTFRVLARFDFTSQRKRSSILVRYTPPNATTSQVVLFTKGADNVIRERLHPENSKLESTLTTFHYVTTYAEQGLRVLCMAKRVIDDELLETWLPQYESAMAKMDDDVVAALMDQLELDLHLQGCVGVEDKLADDVAESIQRLTAAHIKIIMLTGDKMETATNIGLRTKLFPDGANVVRVDCTATAHDTLQQIRQQLYESSLETVTKQLDTTTVRNAFPNDVCVVIDSSCLHNLLMMDPGLVGTVVALAHGVIICRATPQQKATIVGLVREFFHKDVVTLAVGDGGNDCSMIQAANIGVGIRGSEGLQAFNTSDYGISRFQDLVPLLLVHGRWNYRRLAKLTNYSLSKMFVINVPQIVAGFFTLLTPQRIFAESINQFVNPVFSSLAPILFAVLDCDIPGETAIEYPQSYLEGATGRIFCLSIYLCDVLDAILRGVIAGLIPLIIFGYNYVDSSGRPATLWTAGTTSFFCALFLMTQKLNFDCASSLPIVFAVNIASVAIFFPAMFAIRTLRETAHQMFTSPMFYIAWFLTFFLGIFREYAWLVYKRVRHPDLTHRLQEQISRKAGKPPTPLIVEPAIPRRQTLDEFCFFDQPDPSVTQALQQKLYRR